MLNHDCTFTEEYCFQQPLTTMIKGLILTFPHTKKSTNNMAFKEQMKSYIKFQKKMFWIY